MNKCVNLYSYNYNKLLNGIMEYCKTDNEDLVEYILLSCGEKIDDRYIILNNEHNISYNCYVNLFKILDDIFNVKNSFENIRFEDFKQRYMIDSVDIDDVLKEIKLKDYYRNCEHTKGDLLFSEINSNNIIAKFTFKCKKCGKIYDKYYKVEEVEKNIDDIIEEFKKGYYEK